jgi:cyclopropane-fatty-acyl-phospholipid synthase
VHVTSLTLAADSARFIQRLISDKNLSGEVFLQDFLNYKPEKQLDYIVIHGVTEHFPDYQGFASRIWDLLKPGGRVYLDVSAAVTKFAVSSWARQYIWSGTHSFITVQDVMAEFLYHGFEVIEVVRETKDYELTMLEWTKRLDAAKDEVIAGWGEETYRVFRLFLWGWVPCI